MRCHPVHDALTKIRVVSKTYVDCPTSNFDRVSLTLDDLSLCGAPVRRSCFPSKTLLRLAILWSSLSIHERFLLRSPFTLTVEPLGKMTSRRVCSRNRKCAYLDSLRLTVYRMARRPALKVPILITSVVFLDELLHLLTQSGYLLNLKSTPILLETLVEDDLLNFLRH